MLKWEGSKHWGTENTLGRRPRERKEPGAAVVVWPLGGTERRLRGLKQNEQEKWEDEKRLGKHSSARWAEPSGLWWVWEATRRLQAKERQGLIYLYKFAGCSTEYEKVGEKQSKRKLLRVPWNERKSNQSIPKEINPEYSLEGLMLKLKLQYFVHLMRRLTHWKRPWCWKRLRAGGEGANRGWDGWMASSIRSEQTPGDSKEQGSLACCSPWGCKESDTTEWLNNDKEQEQGDQLQGYLIIQARGD